MAGVVRADEIRFNEVDLPDFDSIFGKECLFNDPDEIWKEADDYPYRFMPMGSEGSLRKSVWVNPDVHSMSAYTITIFGNLRDMDDPETIVDWFKKCLDKLCIRQAVITVDCSGKEPITYTHLSN